MKHHVFSLLGIAAFCLFFNVGCAGSGHHDHSDHDHGHSDHDHDIEMHDHEAHHHDEDDLDEHGKHDGEIHFSKAQAEAAGLVTEQIAAGPFTQVLKVNGELLSAEGDEQTLAARTSGVVSYAAGFTMTDGAPVRRGQALFTLSAEGMTGGNPLQQAQAEQTAAREAWNRAERLWQKQLITRTEYEEARQRFLSSSNTQGASTVSATTSGYLKQCLVSSGQFVEEGQALAVITRCRRLQLHADVSARHYNQLQDVRGADLSMPYCDSIYHLSDLNGKLLSVGKATGLSTSSTDFHGSTAGMASPYIPVIFEMDMAPGLFAGSFADVYLLCGERQNVLSVPTSALTEEQGLYFVYVQVDEEGYRKQEVTLGQRGSERVEIVRGLDEGDIVVTRGTYQVKLASVSVVAEGHHHH